ncbi:glycosyltransferase [Paraglaciecola sp. 25GB23A]|uniref:glycosyltransferase n=1 Tax=Paraglaciecola sp. 25GB23A TaxID=3156068 RepID=UPI0032AFBCFC
MKRNKHIWAFPMKGSYTSPLYGCMIDCGVSVKEGVWSLGWFRQHLRREDIVHIHWPSFAYNTTKSTLPAIISFLKFFVILIVIRLSGAKIWWTAHNLLPHDRNFISSFDILARHLIIFFSKRIFVHGSFARKQLETRFPSSRHKNIEIPHGNWINYYGSVSEKNFAKDALSLPKDKFVLLVFGQLRAYKNIHVLIELLKGNQNKDLYLLIAGQFKDDDYQREISDLLKSEPSNIRLDAKFIPNEEVPMYLAASDIMIMPYTEILTSGTAMLAISYGCPIMSIEAGFLRDVITPETGVFISDITDTEIEKAISKAQATNWDATRIIKHAELFTFFNAAKIMFNNLDREID